MRKPLSAKDLKEKLQQPQGNLQRHRKGRNAAPPFKALVARVVLDFLPAPNHHCLGFRLFWRWKSRNREGRPSVDRDLFTLIQRMWQANPTWSSHDGPT